MCRGVNAVSLSHCSLLVGKNVFQEQKMSGTVYFVCVLFCFVCLSGFF